MKANEFVKQYGINEAKRIIPICEKQGAGLTVSGYRVNLDDLKRLVKSHELVERIIKDHNKTFADGQIGLPELRRMAFGAGWKRFPKGLKQAITDVESCL